MQKVDEKFLLSCKLGMIWRSTAHKPAIFLFEWRCHESNKECIWFTTGTDLFAKSGLIYASFCSNPPHFFVAWSQLETQVYSHRYFNVKKIQNTVVKFENKSINMSL